MSLAVFCIQLNRYVYPLYFGLILKKVEYVSIENEVWTKRMARLYSFNDNDSKQKISKEMYLKNLFWLPYWSQNHLKKILNILLPYLAF